MGPPACWPGWRNWKRCRSWARSCGRPGRVCAPETAGGFPFAVSALPFQSGAATGRWEKDVAQEDYPEIRAEVAKLCAAFPGEYWRGLDRENAYPSAFVQALTEAGYLAALIPEEYGGSGLPLSAAAAILEEIQRAGCNGAACHAQIYVMG